MGDGQKLRVDLDRSKEVTFWPGLLVVAVVAILTTAAGSLLDLSENWNEAGFATIVLFVALTLALRRAWGRWQLWRDLGCALVLQIVLSSFIVKLMTAQSRTIGGPLRTLVVIGWGVLLLGILWRRNVLAVRVSG